jgi:pilus assembly protein Flp/PilA
MFLSRLHGGQNQDDRQIGKLIWETDMKTTFTRFINNESGATAIEYGLIAGLIAVVIISALTLVGNKVSAQFQAVASALN